MKDKVIEYLEGQLELNMELLMEFEPKLNPEITEIQKLRELERIRISDKILELKHHIEVIKIL